MLPFPQLVVYGNTAPIPGIGIKRMSNTQQGTAQMLQYSNGELYALGANTNGKFGYGGAGGETITTWTQLSTGVRLYSLAQQTMILIMNDGTVKGSGSLNNIFSAATGGAIANSTSLVDITDRYSTFNIPGIKQIVQYDTQVRQYLIDENNQLWGMGTRTSYVLGNNTNSGSTSWVQIDNGDNCQEIQCTAQGLWIKKINGTWWRCGTNGSGCLVGAAASTTYTTLTQFTDFANLADVSVLSSSLMIRLTDGTMRFYGTQYWINSVGVTFTPYTPTVSGVFAMNISESYLGNFQAITTPNGIMGEGTNGGGSLGIGNTSNAYAGTWYASIGVFTDPSNTALDTSKIKFLCTGNNSGFFAYEDEVYVSGSVGYTQSGAASNGFWQVQRTPRSAIWSAADNHPLLSGTVTNLSSASPVMNRYGHATAVWGKKLLVNGGIISSSAFADTGEINIYDTETGLWSSIANTTSITRYAHAMCVIGDVAYIWGGYTSPSGGTNTNTMYSVNLNTGVWTNLAPSNNITFGAYARMVSTNDGMIYMWGRDIGTQMYQYNPTTNSFVTKTSSTFAAAGPGGSGVSLTNAAGAGFCTDGTYMYNCTAVSQMAKYDPTSNTWKQYQSKTTGAVGKCSFLNGVLYCIINNTLYSYRISTGVWTTGAASLMPGTRNAASMEAINGALYYIGGQGTSSTDNFYKIQ